jgi:hypothetical protein
VCLPVGTKVLSFYLLRRRTDLPRVLLGSVASRLLHVATRPVLIVPRTDTHDESAAPSAVAASAGADQG